MSSYSFDQPLGEIRVDELAHRIAAGDPVQMPVQMIDVREPEEWAIAHLEAFINLPLSQFAAWSSQIQTQFDPDIETIVLCHHGMRSAQMCHWLLQQGFTNVKNVVGGIEAYAAQVDPTLPRY